MAPVPEPPFALKVSGVPYVAVELEEIPKDSCVALVVTVT
jgi:hypothetical protein